MLLLSVAFGCGGQDLSPSEGGVGKPPLDAGTQVDRGVDGSTGGVIPCAFDPSELPPHVALAAGLNGSVVFLMTDGSIHTVYRFAPNAPPDRGSFAVQVSRYGGYLVAIGSLLAHPDECSIEGGIAICPESDIVVLLDIDGHLLWEKRLSGRIPYGRGGVNAIVGEGGTVVVWGALGATFVAPDGGEQPFPWFAPLARPFAGPAVPVAVFTQASASNVFAWWRPGQTAIPVEPPLSIDSPLDLVDTGTELAFVATAVDGTRVIVHASPDLTAALPGSVDLGDSAARLRAGAWRAVNAGAEIVRFNLLTGETGRFTQALPIGLRSLGTDINQAGAFIGVLRDDFSAGVFLSADAASGWTRIGQTLGQVETVNVLDFGGTYLIMAQGTKDFFVPEQQWQSAPTGQEPELLQRSNQIVRPADGVVTVIDPFWFPVNVTRDGRCAAYWQSLPSGLRLMVHDIVSGTRLPTLESHDATPPVTVWID